MKLKQIYLRTSLNLPRMGKTVCGMAGRDFQTGVMRNRHE